MSNSFGKEVEEDKKKDEDYENDARKQKENISRTTREIKAGEDNEEVRKREAAGEQGRSRPFREEEKYDEGRYERGCRIKRRKNEIRRRKYGEKKSGVKTLLLVFRILRNPGFYSRPRDQLYLLRFSVLTFIQRLNGK
jgi:hypothetical protein